jgi:hypothetical protein
MQLHMDMASAAGIDTWNDGLQPTTALIVGQLMATQAKTGVIVFAAGICLPEIEHYLRHRNAAPLITRPERTRWRPSIPGSSKKRRSGECGLK